MKKILVFLMVFLAVLPVFSSGEEEQQNIVMNLPYFGNVSTTTSRTDSVIDSNMASLTRLYRMLEENYLWDIDHQAVYDAMAKAMFDALGDKYSEYFTSEEEQNAHFNNLKPETKPLTYCFCRRGDSWMES